MSYPDHLLDALGRVYVEAVVDQLLADLQNEQGPTPQTSGPVIDINEVSTSNAEVIADPA